MNTDTHSAGLSSVTLNMQWNISFETAITPKHVLHNLIPCVCACKLVFRSVPIKMIEPTWTVYVHLTKYCEIIAWISLYCGSNEGFWIVYCGRERIEVFEKRDKISGLFMYKTHGAVEITFLHICPRNIVQYKFKN